MAVPRKPHGPAAGDAADLLQVLMFRRLITREQADRVRKYARANSTGVLPTIVELPPLPGQVRGHGR